MVEHMQFIFLSRDCLQGLNGEFGIFYVLPFADCFSFSFCLVFLYIMEKRAEIKTH